VYYEKRFGISFWDYSQLKGNLHGRVCPIFSIFWGLLAVVLVHRVHPLVAKAVSVFPGPLSTSALLLLVADTLYTGVLLRRTRSTDSLRWYRKA